MFSVLCPCCLLNHLGGSTLEYAQEMIAALHVIIGQLKQYLGVDRIRMSDVPCRDLQWMSRFLQTRTDVEYRTDIVGEVIQHHRKTFSSRPWKFLNVDVLSAPGQKANRTKGHRTEGHSDKRPMDKSHSSLPLILSNVSMSTYTSLV